MADLVSVRGAIDLHVHSYPCVFPRLADDRETVRAAAEKGMAGILLKCHHESTVSRAYLLQSEFPEIKVFGGIVLNQYVGGINPAAAEVALRLGAKEVWMPTIDAAHHVEVHGARGSYDVQAAGGEFVWGEPVTVLRDDRLTEEAIVVLELIARHDAILGTAHLSLAEILPLVKEARQRGVQKILITHPYFRVPAGMSLEFLQEMARLGAVAEFGFCTVSPMWAYATVEQTRAAMEALGYDNCVIMSDAGQRHNPISPEAVRIYAQCLYEKGVKERELEQLMSVNPKALLGLD